MSALGEGERERSLNVARLVFRLGTLGAAGKVTIFTGTGHLTIQMISKRVYYVEIVAKFPFKSIFAKGMYNFVLYCVCLCVFLCACVPVCMCVYVCICLSEFVCKGKGVKSTWRNSRDHGEHIPGHQFEDRE
ncbi:hypothetical protein AALO_G00010250 [Alosa alosa]|uniref:Uncharacterized protein n=1 Tax=Alosa alosa TaxID=278164 RepID=A0AAV6HG18_9TELE|nr:hypothetical protein AALO_G00010250 [Alosa alosa]